MCTVLLRFNPGSPWPVLLAAVRDEYLARPWEPPAEHWPGRFGGRDSTGGGTWLAVDPARPGVNAVLNGFPPLPSQGDRPTRGALPLGTVPDDEVLRTFDAFHLVRAEPTEVEVISWNGGSIERRLLEPGDHVIVNQGIDVNDFAPLRLAATPNPKPGPATADAWGDWVGLLAGGEFTGAAERPILVRREVDGLEYGSGSAALIAIGEPGVRYDFTANPGPSAVWREIPLPGSL
ncbi:NRDE family protein [Dactylosporangium roseum]|uniref:NRDE family protein n=1 Tax=Dactylosporangium roseum TaxID=47989 RepID=A0ABY5Z2B4_9ACTN|nr:NRDE family protein [Dactylosporangium roseum]UWZ36145.1 NRDE family protein [Dactylosporangium roseum]